MACCLRLITATVKSTQRERRLIPMTLGWFWTEMATERLTVARRCSATLRPNLRRLQENSGMVFWRLPNTIRLEIAVIMMAG